MNESTFTDEETGGGESRVVGEPREVQDDRWYPGKYSRRALLAGVGALVAAMDAAGETFDTYADRGERVASELRTRVENARHQNDGAGQRVQEFARTGVNAVLDAIGVPNKGDVETINVKLNIMGRKLDDLSTTRIQPAPTSATQPDKP